MSSGSQHYAEAERLLWLAESDVSENWRANTGDHKADVLAAAQVHATLALAAATAYTAVRDWMGDECRDGADWSRVTARSILRETGESE